MAAAVALIHEEDGVCGVSFPDFPGCTTTARSLDDALRKGSEALTFHVAGMVADGESLPVNRSLEALRSDPTFVEDSEGAVVAVVQYERPGRSIRVNISIEETLLEALDRAAKDRRQSRSAFLAEAVRQRLVAA